jgi:hypothetical protein
MRCPRVGFFGGLPNYWAGWGFSREDRFIHDIAGVDWKPLTMDEIKNTFMTPDKIDDFMESLKTDPLFKQQPGCLFARSAELLLYADSTLISSYNKANYGHSLHEPVKGCNFRDWLLANAFPARTLPIGAHPSA